MKHWRPILQYTGYALIALAGFLLWPIAGVALAGVVLVMIANGW